MNSPDRVKDDINQQRTSQTLERRQPTRSEEEISTEAMRTSLSFKKDLASLDAGLLHNPAKGTIYMKTDPRPKVVEENPHPNSQYKSEVPTDDDSNANNELQDLAPISEVLEGKSESTFQEYRRRLQGLFFPPWRPYTSINLELDPEIEYSDPDMAHYSPMQPEVAIDQEKESSVVAEPKLENETIHILGLGSIGKYIAHTLASLPFAPPITLLMHRPLVMQRWHDEGAAIRLVKDGELHVQSGFNIESAASFRREFPDQVFPHFGKNFEHSAEPPNTIIETLIVATDSETTMPALEAIKHRLRERSTICFLQHGLGIAEKVSAEIFTDPIRRPTYVLGSISHQIAGTNQSFTIIEKRTGILTCSKLPQRSVDNTQGVPIVRSDFSWSPQATHLVGTLTRAQDLNTKPLGHKSFYKLHLHKVVLGCIIGPLSVLYDCSNDQLLYNYNASVSMRQLLEEISEVICSLPELKTLDGIYENFNVHKLEARCISVIAGTGKQESRMLQAVRAGKRTNIDYFNGWITRRGAQLGIHCPKNELILSIVKGKTAVKSKEISGYIPLIALQ